MLRCSRPNRSRHTCFQRRERNSASRFASVLANDGLDEAVAVLLAFALVDRESIPDERDASILTDCIRLHRLVRQVAISRRDHEERERSLAVLAGALVAVYPADVFDDPQTWPRARRLDALALALANDEELPKGARSDAAALCARLASYRQGFLAAYELAQPLCERALAIDEKESGPDHPTTARSLHNLAVLLRTRGDLKKARML